MNETIKRIITGVIAGALFFLAYAYSQIVFSKLLIALLALILFFEWPKLLNIRTKEFWLTTIFYPVFPVICLLYLNSYYREIDILIPLYPFFIAWVYDTGAYTVGVFFGKHKIAPTISPKKTWEGLCGGFASVCTLHALLVYYRPAFDVLGSVDIVSILVQSIMLTLVAFFGDLFVSFLKRRAGVKDSGIALPGHGGLLDRFDSVFFVAVYVVAYSFLRA